MGSVARRPLLRFARSLVRVGADSGGCSGVAGAAWVQKRGGGETQKFGGLGGLLSGFDRLLGFGLEVKRGLEKPLGLVVVVSVIGFGFGCWVGLDVCQGLTPNFPGWLQACQAKGAWGYYYYSLFDFQVFF